MSFAARARSARAANDTTRAQINNIPEKSHVIPLFTGLNHCSQAFPVHKTTTCLTGVADDEARKNYSDLEISLRNTYLEEISTVKVFKKDV